jgi:hypothetical protein
MPGGNEIQAVEELIRSRGGFGHREHLELAYTYLGRGTLTEAQKRMASAIRHVSQMHGMPDRYHDTITGSWVQLVAVHRRHSGAGSFDEFIAENPGLLDRHLLERHYSRELLGSAGARQSWTEPDLIRLPAAA